MEDLTSRILIVDDLPSNVKIVEAILLEQGYSVASATSGPMALTMIEQEPIDLVLLDVMMPEMDGYETCRLIRERSGSRPIPVIFLTALSEKEDIVQGFQAGGVDFVPKPFNKSELLMRVKTHLDLQGAHRDLNRKNMILEKIATELRESNLARDKFVSILAHDLKNPFSGLIGLIDEILKYLPTMNTEELKEIFQTLQSSSKNVYNLLLTLLEWGRTQTGALVLKISNIDLAPIVAEIVTSFEVNLKLKKIDLRVELESTSLHGDVATISTVLRNLVSNAIKYTREGGTIRIWARKEFSTIRIEISDTGIGMKPAILENLFRLDYKVSTPGTNHETGTGLGLLLCKEFVEKNDGTIAVSSVYGQGTTFVLVFPSD